MRARQSGMALLGALVIVVLVVALAASIGLRSAHGIAATARGFEARAATPLFEALEDEARRALTRDARGEAFDAEDDLWAQVPLLVERAEGRGNATLRDAQALFNLRDIAFTPDVIAAGGDAPPQADDTPPPPARDASAGEDAALGGGAGGGLESRKRRIAPGGADDAAAPGGDSLAMMALASLPGVVGPGMPTGAGAEGQGLTLSEQQVAVARLALLLRTLEIDDAVLPAILDWLDADSETRFPNGAEDDYYMRQSPPYRAANRAFADVSELRLVRGIDAKTYEKLRKFVTVLPMTTPINLNTAPIEVLMSLSPAFDRSTAEMIEQTRRVRPLRSVAELMALPMVAGRPVVSEGLAVNSQYFNLRMQVRSGDSLFTARALLARPGGDAVTVLSRDKGWFDE
ncbi:MAG: type II secretion system minor pseudopilin GspK [Gammaproteobacteria bacterium]|nr:type II secretion system minor pseudopilin GspK [Gammaproteobacteria bacterium]